MKIGKFDYEEVAVIPSIRLPTGGNWNLRPGQIIRRPIESASGAYGANFKRMGLTDYHVATRTVDGQYYLYIWRDPLPAGTESGNGS